MKIVFTGLLLLAGLIWSAVWQLPDQKLHVIFCDVGQGDAILITHGQTQVLVDGGPGDQVLTCLADHLPYWDRQLEMIILTHPDADHLTGLIDVIKRYDVKQFVLNNVIKDTAAFWAFREVVLAEGAPIYSPEANEQIKLGLMKFQALWPSSDSDPGSEQTYDPGSSKEQVLGVASEVKKINETSIVSLLSFGNFDVFLSGDIGFDTEKKLSLNSLPLIEILKVPHHGSRYSSSEDFLAKVNPDLAVISVGRNSFGHPTDEVLERLAGAGAKVLRTDQDGEIEIVSDGRAWQVVDN